MHTIQNLTLKSRTYRDLSNVHSKPMKKILTSNEDQMSFGIEKLKITQKKTDLQTRPSYGVATPLGKDAY